MALKQVSESERWRDGGRKGVANDATCVIVKIMINAKVYMYICVYSYIHALCLYK